MHATPVLKLYQQNPAHTLSDNNYNDVMLLCNLLLINEFYSEAHFNLLEINRCRSCIISLHYDPEITS